MDFYVSGIEGIDRWNSRREVWRVNECEADEEREREWKWEEKDIDNEK